MMLLCVDVFVFCVEYVYSPTDGECFNVDCMQCVDVVHQLDMLVNCWQTVALLCVDEMCLTWTEDHKSATYMVKSKSLSQIGRGIDKIVFKLLPESIPLLIVDFLCYPHIISAWHSVEAQ